MSARLRTFSRRFLHAVIRVSDSASLNPNDSAQFSPYSLLMGFAREINCKMQFDSRLGAHLNFMATKEDLERRKVELEIRDLERHWWQRPAYLSILIPIV